MSYWDSGHPFRWRTWLRAHLPWFLINVGIADKGEDCERAGGVHWWYNKDGEHSACYHCNVERQGQLWREEDQSMQRYHTKPNKPDTVNPAMRPDFTASISGAGSLIRDVRHTRNMRVVFIRLFMVYLPLAFVALLQLTALLVIYAGTIGGPNDSTIDLSTHVTGLRFGWPLLVVAATIYHVVHRRTAPQKDGHP